MPRPLDEILRRSSFFRFLPEERYDSVCELLREQRLDFGEVIVRQGEEADAFYILTSGRARVIKETADGKEIALAGLRPGDEFGEQALLQGGLRTATVRCSTAVELLRLDRDDFTTLLGQIPELKSALDLTARHRALHDFLYEFSNFGRLPANALRGLLTKLSPATFAKGDQIIREGDAAGPMFVVESGHVRVYSQKNGKSRNLAFYREGEFFGELAVLNGLPRAASAEAVTEARLLALEPAAVVELEEEFPEFRRLLEERRAQYSVDAEARVPLDFAEEALPAESRVHDKTAGVSGATEEELFADEGGFFHKRPRIRHMPHVPQIDEMDCGAASLGMICRYFGRKVSLAHIRELCHTARDGTSLKAICQAAGEVGLAARALKVSPRNLPEVPLPAIVHWEGNHWMVLYQVNRKFVRVNDPGLGPRRISRSAFAEGWSGYTALFDYTTALDNAPESGSMLNRFLPMFRQHTGVLVQVLLLAAVATILELLFPIFTQVVVDRVIVENDVGLLKIVLLGMAATVVFAQITTLLQQYLISFSAVRLDAALLDFLTRALLALPMSYFNGRRTGDIQRRLDGARQVRLFVVQHGIGGVLALITLVGAVSLMFTYNLKLAAVFLCTPPLYAGLMWWSAKVLRPLFAEIEESQGKYSSHQIDAIKGIEAVKAASAELVFRDTMLNEFLGVSRKMFRSNFILMSYDGVLQSIGMLSTMLFLWVGANQVIEGAMTVGGFVAFSSLTAMAYASIMRALGLWDQWQFISVLLSRLNDIFEPEPEQGRDRTRLAAVPSLEGHIALRNVGFRYGGPEAPSILKGLDLEFPRGKVIAIVGRSGSGKTTLIKLLAGLVEPTEGVILYDRVDLKTLNYRDVRRQIGMVLQENHMFSESIVRNIAFGDPEPDFDRVLWSAQTANAHQFIMNLPMGYETPIGESGLALSGGQKQRIAIARALYGDPPILIFDEATSALDTESERAIQSNLARMMSGRTCVVIAHRLSTIRDANMIVVLEKGEVAETGTHEELMARRGLYFHLSSQQLGV
jgi:HlyB family type I secretion system ABC transporter